MKAEDGMRQGRERYQMQEIIKEEEEGNKKKGERMRKQEGLEEERRYDEKWKNELI